MATVPGGTIWTNPDGLRVRFGTDEATSALVGSPAQSGSYKEVIADFTYADLPAFGTETFLGGVPRVALPAGVLLREVLLIPTAAWASSGSATLTLGLSKQDGTTIDADGIDATIAKTAIDAIGETVTCDGALINTVLAYDSYLSVTVGTADFNAGAMKMVIKYIHQN